MSRAKSKEMTKSLEPIASKESKKPRGRKGGRTPLPEGEKKEIAHIHLPRWLLAAFKELVPLGRDRSNLILGWVRAYVVANGESDRLLTQSPLSLRLLNYLEATGTPEAEDLAEELLSLIVTRESDEAKLDNGAIKLKGDSYII